MQAVTIRSRLSHGQPGDRTAVMHFMARVPAATVRIVRHGVAA
ncbi:hypothetical protein GCM10009524_00050 [Spirilliplanes yamanashiensis]